jgi:hypothetical protein
VLEPSLRLSVQACIVSELSADVLVIGLQCFAPREIKMLVSRSRALDKLKCAIGHQNVTEIC